MVVTCTTTLETGHRPIRWLQGTILVALWLKSEKGSRPLKLETKSQLSVSHTVDNVPIAEQDTTTIVRNVAGSLIKPMVDLLNLPLFIPPD